MSKVFQPTDSPPATKTAPSPGMVSKPPGINLGQFVFMLYALSYVRTSAISWDPSMSTLKTTSEVLSIFYVKHAAAATSSSTTYYLDFACAVHLLAFCTSERRASSRREEDWFRYLAELIQDIAPIPPSCSIIYVHAWLATL